jgi:hypothetical protein
MDNKSRVEPTRDKDVKKNTFEAGMCMKTNKTSAVCGSRMAAFLRDLGKFSAVLSRHWRISLEL